MINNFINQNHICLTSSADINEIARPFFEITKLSYFSYAQDFNLNESYKSFSLQTHNQIYLSWFKNLSPYLSSSMKNGVYTWYNVQNEGVNQDTQALNFGNGIYIVKHHNTFTEIFGFNAYVNKRDLLQFYINNIQLFNKFCLYFKDQAWPIISFAKNNSLDVPKEMLVNDIRYEKDALVYEQLKRALKIKKYNFDDKYNQIKLSKRELQCLRAYLKGETASQIGFELNLSKPTIDTFLLNIKKKFNCDNKSDLFKIFWELGIIISDGVIDV